MRHKIEIVNNEPVRTPIEDEEVLEPEAQDTPTEPMAEAEAGSGTAELNPDAVDLHSLPDNNALLAEMEDLRTQKEDAEKRLLYLQAEFQNYRRRMTEEKASLDKFAGEKVIKELLPIVDNFERGLNAAKTTSNFDALVGGVSGVLKQMDALLQKSGVTPIEAVGKEFDPNLHEAIGMAEDSDLPANTVAEELQRGYLLHDRVLRPSLVKVSQG
jgi:molecular chaperone GrpE